MINIKYGILFLCLVLLCYCKSQSHPILKTESKIIDLGVFRRGEKVINTLKIKNIGGSYLKIRSIDASCNCTIVEFSKDPIPPNAEINVKILYDSENDSHGVIQRALVIEANTKPILHTILIKGYVMS